MPPCQGNLHKVAAPYFYFIYIVQLYKEDSTILQICECVGCWVIALPGTEQSEQQLQTIEHPVYWNIHDEFL